MKTTVQYCFLFLLLFITKGTEAQDVYKLWEGQEKPYYKENELKEYEEELWGTTCLLNVTEPDYDNDEQTAETVKFN